MEKRKRDDSLRKKKASFRRIHGLSTSTGVAELVDEFKTAQLQKILRERYPHIKQYHDLSRFSLCMAGVASPDEIYEEVERRAISLVKAKGSIGNFITYSRAEIRSLAVSMAELEYPAPTSKIEMAERFLGHSIPGDSVKSQFARTCTASFWRRAITIAVERAREHIFLRLGKVKKYGEFYASDLAVDARRSQIRMQQKWMENTKLVMKQDEEAPTTQEMKKVEISLSDVVKGPEERFAKLYAFVAAMDALALKSKLNAAMLTITLEPEWHASPSKGVQSWNGESPKAAHESFCDRWQAVLRDLHRNGIRLSGLRVVEPHGDACPHYHTWVLYRPEHEKKILATIMNYFKLKLKIRSSSKGNSSNDLIYESKEDLLCNRFRSRRQGEEGAQVDFARINRDEGNGVSYVMVYITKTLQGGSCASLDNPFEKPSEGKTSTTKGMERVDAFRAVWGINQGQLFGVAKCLTVWDQFRRMQTAPTHWFLRKLWELARGGSAEGRIEKNQGKRGNAYGFLEALGGLDAARNGKRARKRYAIKRLIEESSNKYGDKISKTVGITLVRKEYKQVTIKRGHLSKRRVAQTTTRVITSLKIRLAQWIFETKPRRISTPAPCK